MSMVQFAKGDVVIHAGKPEWGPGDVLSSENTVHEGKPVQRLSIRFARGGLKTLTTAFAELVPAKDHKGSQALATATALLEDKPTAALDRSLDEALLALPENITDPFLSMGKRLEATLALYAKGEKPSGLLDWATGQTGLRDPLTRFNRHELEAWFDRFRIALDAHLRKLLRDARKQEPAIVEKILRAQVSPACKAALRRADIGR
jgi:hypothetical protein